MPHLDLSVTVKKPRPERIVRNKACRWSRATAGDIASDWWTTSCGNSFVLNDGTPSENNMRFCCYCGGALPRPRKGNARRD